MTSHRVSSLFFTILRGYRRTAGGFLRLLLIVATAAALGCLVVWPLWYLAVHAAGPFSIMVMILLPAAVILSKILTARKGGNRPNLKNLAKGILTVLSFLLCAAVAFLTVFLFVSGRPALFAVSALAFFFAAGYFAYGRS